LESKAKYARFNRWEGVGFVLITVALIALAYRGFQELAQVRYRLLPAAVHTLVPDQIPWLLPAMFLGLGVASVLAFAWRRVLLGPRAHEYDELDWIQLGGDPRRGRRIFFVCMLVYAVGIPLFVTVVLNTYTLLAPDAIIDRPFGSRRDTRHRYDDITSLSWVGYMTESGHLVERPHVLVRFRDGSRWSSCLDGSRTPTPEDRDVLSFLHDHTGLRVEQARIDP
jgi:hypothetical protein